MPPLDDARPLRNKLSISKKRRLNQQISDGKKPKTDEMSSYHHAHHHHHHHYNGNGVGYANGVSTNGKSASSSAASSTTSSSTKSPSVASLCNLGNTCFLNSVLYTLRFTPGFLHNLHHMTHDLRLKNNNNGYKKRVTNGFGDDPTDGEMVQEVIDQLHELFRKLSCADDALENSSVSAIGKEPIPPTSFLNAVGRFNPLFEGNQQQDAHELLVLILNVLEEIKIPVISETIEPDVKMLSSLPPAAAPLPPEKKARKKKASVILNGGRYTPSTNSLPPSRTQSPAPSNNKMNGTHSMTLNTDHLPNFIRENFEGKSVMRTRCLECEMSTYSPDKFTFINVPLNLDDVEDEDLSAKDLFLKLIMTSETLRENNKYWCEECSRLNEAQISVEYERLPKILVLQLKRFTLTGSKYLSKINDYVPTPFSLNCFCQQCLSKSSRGGANPRHHYRLYAVIMHLGATLASGHYIAYVRAGGNSEEYLQCQRVETHENGSNSNGGSSTTIHPVPTVERSKSKKGIMKKWLRRGGSGSSHDTPNGSLSNGDLHSASAATMTSSVSSLPCRSANCCGIRGGLRGFAAPSPTPRSSFDDAAADASLRQTSSSASLDKTSVCDDEIWLECDDENIQAVTRRKLEENLATRQGATTPYLLFYQRVE